MEILYIIIIAAVIAGLYVKTLMGTMNNVTRQNQANFYMKEDSYQLSDKRDKFMFSNVTRIAKPQNNNGGPGHGSRGGGRPGGGRPGGGRPGGGRR